MVRLPKNTYYPYLRKKIAGEFAIEKEKKAYERSLIG